MKRRKRKSQRAPILGASLLAVFLLSGMIWWIHGFMSGKAQKTERTVQNITLIRPPPPPPDTPPPPPPEKVEEHLEQKEPDPTPDNTPTPSPQLGLDAEGTAGGDAFGLAARKGGSDLVGTGGAAFAWYTGKLRDEITDHLSNDARVRAKKFTISLRIWLDRDGRVKDVRMTSTTGDHELDSLIASSLSSMASLSEAPPIEMPQPISVKIVSRI
jgi:protein TonB